MITIDFETFYSREFSLTKLTTEEYVRSPEFQVIGVAVKLNDGPAEWFSGTLEETAEFLAQYDWGNQFVLAHNAMFDAAILSWVFGQKPKAWLDTLSMARALFGTTISGRLAVLAEHFGLGQKGTEVEDARGLRREDFPAEQLARYGEYCKNDVNLTYDLYQTMNVDFPTVEKRLIDLTIRMYSDPMLELDTERLEEHLREVRERKEKLFTEAGITKEILNSSAQFAELLRAHGVEPPTKISPATGKETFAFAKTDQDFLILQEHPNETVQALVAARLGAKSTLEETRTERFIDISRRGHIAGALRRLPIPLKYYAAHTGRWGGADKVNLQNLPSRGEQGGKLKRCIVAPKGHVIIDCDSSQIEARVLAYLAGQDDVLKLFAAKADVYKYMASLIYGKADEDITPEERFIGKTTVLGCISEGTLVLSDSGWKPIEQVTTGDKLWDGEEWVCHRGLQNSGIKETLNLCGMWLTPDHKVWSGTQWLDAQFLAQDANIRSQALGTAVENLPSQATYGVIGEGLVHLSSDVSADLTWNTVWTHIISKISRAHGVRFAPKLLPTKSGIGCIRTHWQMTCTEHDFLTDWHLPSQDVTPQQVESTCTTAGEVYQSSSSGVMTERHSFGTFKLLRAGMSRILKWTGLMSTETTSPEIFGLYPEATTSKTNDASQTSRRKLQTYDLAYAGPRNRYTVLTENGPLIVHNCGYGMGAIKFQRQLLTMGKAVDYDTCAHIIKRYRQANHAIAMWWNDLSRLLDFMTQNKESDVDVRGILTLTPFTGIRLPNGLHLNYPELTRHNNGDFTYKTRMGIQKIYGGKVAENLCQAVARCIIGEQMILISQRYRPVLTVHDAVACVVPEDEANEARAFIEHCMRIAPSWASNIPLNCESGMARNYGDC